MLFVEESALYTTKILGKRGQWAGRRNYALGHTICNRRGESTADRRKAQRCKSGRWCARLPCWSGSTPDSHEQWVTRKGGGGGGGASRRRVAYSWGEGERKLPLEKVRRLNATPRQRQLRPGQGPGKTSISCARDHWQSCSRVPRQQWWCDLCSEGHRRAIGAMPESCRRRNSPTPPCDLARALIPGPAVRLRSSPK